MWQAWKSPGAKKVISAWTDQTEDKRERWGLYQANDKSLHLKVSKESQHWTSPMRRVGEEGSLRGLWPGSGFRCRPQAHAGAKWEPGAGSQMWTWTCPCRPGLIQLHFWKISFSRKGPRGEAEMQAADVVIRSVASSTSLPGFKSGLCPPQGLWVIQGPHSAWLCLYFLIFQWEQHIHQKVVFRIKSGNACKVPRTLPGTQEALS